MATTSNDSSEVDANEAVQVNENGQSKKTSVATFIFLATYFMTRPIVFPFIVMRYGFRQTKNITLVIYNEMAKVGNLGMYTLELGVLVFKSINIILFKDGDTKPLMPRMMNVYNRMADTLTDIHALPSTKESGTLIHLMLNRLPRGIWEYILPYPHPFFKGSVTQASKTKSNKLITSMEKVPNDQYGPCNEYNRPKYA